MATAVEACVHCGFCLPTCPTYVTMEEEMDSPRGRIFLMKEVLEGGLELEAALPFVDNCLGCQACITACPSGVEYGDLITAFREHAEIRRERPPAQRAQRVAMLRTLSSPRRFRLAARVGLATRRLSRVLPESLGSVFRLLPARLPRAPRSRPVHHVEGERRARVALLTGCAQQVLAPGINEAAIRVLARNGIETTVPSRQGCCGALAMHAGDGAYARRLARRNFNAFGGDIDAVVTTAAGCGSGMREYGLLFRGEPDEAAASELADRVADVAELLASLGLRTEPPPVKPGIKVAYQDACHLAHAQGVRSAPRRLLESIDGLELVEPAEPELCCGSAGTYNLEKPEIAERLGKRKVRNLEATGADLIASGNIGCLSQLRRHSGDLGRSLPAAHTIEILDAAYSRTLPEMISRPPS